MSTLLENLTGTVSIWKKRLRDHPENFTAADLLVWIEKHVDRETNKQQVIREEVLKAQENNGWQARDLPVRTRPTLNGELDKALLRAHRLRERQEAADAAYVALTPDQRQQLADYREAAEDNFNVAKRLGVHPEILRQLMPVFMVAEEKAQKKLPTTPGSVVQADSLLMLTRFGNWVSDGVFTITAEELQEEDFTIIFDAGKDTK